MIPDTSGAVELLLNTAAGKRLSARLADGFEAVHVPHCIDIEITQVFCRHVLRGVLDDRPGAMALGRWMDFDVERHPHQPFLGRI